LHAPIEDKSDYYKWVAFMRNWSRCLVNAKIEREDIFKPTIGNENSRAISNDNDVRAINFATSSSNIHHVLTDERGGETVSK
jgi:hypothetical protein